MTRFGIGYDIHRLEEGRPFVLAGIEIPSRLGPRGHSDGDPLSHAVADAALGACALGDIGDHFPDSDPAFLGLPGPALLERTRRLIEENGFVIRQVDSVVVCQAPPLAPWRERIAGGLARALGIEAGLAGLKFKTNEKLDAVGRGRAIAAWAVVNLENRP